MLFRRSGFPEEGELVFCTVTQIQFHSVFVNLDDYDKSGMIHISEISPGRIRNIRDYVKPDKKIVCVVLRIHHDKGHIDLSLRRVNEGQRRKKVEEVKQEQKAEKIIEIVAAELKQPLKQFYKEIASHILEEYEMIYPAFIEVVENDLSLETLGIEKKIADTLTKQIKDKIKPKRVEISGKISIVSYDEDGLELIKNILLSALKVHEAIKIKYEGGGKFVMGVGFLF